MADERDKIAQETQDMYQKYYKQTYDPAKAGADAFRRAVSRQLGESYRQQEATGRTYGDLYQQARSQATRQGAMSSTVGFGGGRAEGLSSRISAAEMAQLTGISAQREGAMRDIAAQRQAIPSNALIESQQAKDYARAESAAEQQRVEQAIQIIGSVNSYDKLSAASKARLTALGYDKKAIENFIKLQTSKTPQINQSTYGYDSGILADIPDDIRLKD